MAASLFNAEFRPDSGILEANIVLTSSVQGNIYFDIALNVYGYRALTQQLDPCDLDQESLCPMNIGKFQQRFSTEIGSDVTDMVPGIAYTIPDLDASLRIYANRSDTNEAVACVEAKFVNGKTVDLSAVKWATAAVTGLGFLVAGIISIIGHSDNTAAHLAAATLSLFGYFQAQAMLGLTGVHLPPIAQAWTQNFVWSVGLIRIGWMQNVLTWFQRATGGTPATLFNALLTYSVQVLRKRSLDLLERANPIAKRANIQHSTGSYIVYGIQRVAFRAEIESTNVFMTTLVFFCFLVVCVTLITAVLYYSLKLFVRQGWVNEKRFTAFRECWPTVLKGILLRLLLVGFPAIAIFCLWEFTQVDSPAMVVLAVFYFFGALATLGWAAYQIILLARHSIDVYTTPAYLLFTDPEALDKWSFLYIQFRASAYYYVVPTLAHLLIKAAIIAFGQHERVVQAVMLIIVEAGALIGASVLRPWMDKSANTLGIAICAVNFFNAILLFLCTNVLGLHGLVVGVSGIVLFFVNAVVSLVLLILVIASSAVLFWKKNPDNRYRFMADDRASFLRSRTDLDKTNELDALAVTARGKSRENFMYDDDSRSASSGAKVRGDEASSPSPTPKYR